MFKSRIKNDFMVQYIDLTDSESKLYRGAGDAIAFVDSEGQIERLLYVHLLGPDGAKEVENEVLEHSNAWFGICSRYQFCKPRKLDGENMALFARIAQQVADNWHV